MNSKEQKEAYTDYKARVESGESSEILHLLVSDLWVIADSNGNDILRDACEILMQDIEFELGLRA